MHPRQLIVVWLTCKILSTITLLAFLIQSLTGLTTVRFRMFEEEASGKLVGRLLDQLPNHDLDHSNVMFRPNQDTNHAKYFSVGPRDGEIRIASRIDRETLCPHDDTSAGRRDNSSCQLVLMVNLLTGLTNIVDVIQVIISIEDKNDNNCHFLPSDQQLIRIDENSHLYSNIPLYRLVDLDSAAMPPSIDRNLITLTDKHSHHQSDKFHLSINETDSLIEPYSLGLKLVESLDYESQTSYDLLVSVFQAIPDGSNQMNCQLNVNIQIKDVNDHAPKFAQKLAIVEVPENASLALPIYTASAFDSDTGPVNSQLRYSIDQRASSLINSIFRVDELNGSVFLNRPLNYREHGKFVVPLVVRNPASEAADDNLFDTAQLNVEVLDVNDQPPKIQIHTLDGDSMISIREHVETQPMDFAILTVTDDDSGSSGRCECQLDSESSINLIKLTPMSSLLTSSQDSSEHQQEMIFKLSSIESVDREIVDKISLTIICHDFGHPQLTSKTIILVLVDDINDNSPVFDQKYYQFAVNEDSDPRRASVNYVVGQVSASDADLGPNAKIVYSLSDDNNASTYFSINSSTGLIRSRGNMDREHSAGHKFHVTAADGDGSDLQHTSSVLVEVIVNDFNDERPMFGQNSYQFHIDENSEQGLYIGSIEARDLDLGSNAVINFSAQSLTTSSQQPIVDGILTGQLSRQLPFDLVSYFDETRNAYEIRIYTSKSLDREESKRPDAQQTTSHQRIRPQMQADARLKEDQSSGDDQVSIDFWVVGEDKGLPDRQRNQVLIHVLLEDVNDHAPVFLKPRENFTSFTVSYFEQPGHVITRILATDPDAGLNGTVRYQLKHTSLVAPSSTSPLNNRTSTRHGEVRHVDDSIGIHEQSGAIYLTQSLTKSHANVGYILELVAHDLGIPRQLESTLLLIVTFDDSVPVGDLNGPNMFEQLAASSSHNALDQGTGNLSINFYIIIAIVGASFVISLLLIALIGIALSRKRRRSDRCPTRQTKLANGDCVSTSDSTKSQQQHLCLVSLPITAEEKDSILPPFDSDPRMSPISCNSPLLTRANTATNKLLPTSSLIGGESTTFLAYSSNSQLVPIVSVDQLVQSGAGTLLTQQHPTNLVGLSAECCDGDDDLASHASTTTPIQLIPAPSSAPLHPVTSHAILLCPTHQNQHHSDSLRTPSIHNDGSPQQMPPQLLTQILVTTNHSSVSSPPRVTDHQQVDLFSRTNNFQTDISSDTYKPEEDSVEYSEYYDGCEYGHTINNWA